MQAEERDLERDIFGGSDSELSDSDDERELPARIVPTPREEEEESSGPDSEDNYVQDTQKPVKVKIKKKRSSRRDGDGERAARKRKRKAPQYTEEDLNEMPPEQARALRMDMQIESILKPKKTARPKKRKANEEVLDSFADDEVARLREAMNAAADDDIRANSEKRPAMAKLRLLPEAMEIMRKTSSAQSMIDNNLFEAVKRWLEPLPDRSLPSLDVQREFFQMLKKMEFIDSAVLRESGLGKIVLFYSKNKHVNPDVIKIAKGLVETWSRPIIKRSASYRDVVVPTAQIDSQDLRMERLPTIMARAKEKDRHRVKRNTVSIPEAQRGYYTVAPQMNSGVMRGSMSVDADVARRRNNADRLRSLTRKVGNK